MATPPPSLYLDEDVSVVVAAILRARGFEATTARDIGQLGRSDFGQLTFAAEVGCVVKLTIASDFLSGAFSKSSALKRTGDTPWPTF
jgi:hypothetical protein